MDNRNNISYILAGYNEQNNIENAIQVSLDFLGQHYTDYELILIDDGSLDNTFNIMQKYQDKYPDKIVFLPNYINLNFGASILRGVFYAKKDIILFNAIDLPFNHMDIPRCISKMNDEKIDLLVVERTGYNPVKWRKVTSELNITLLRILFPKLMNGLNVVNFVQIFDRSIINTIKPLSRSPIFVWPEMIFRAKLAKLNVSTISVIMQEQEKSAGSFGKFHDIVWGIYDMLRFKFSKK